MNCLAQLRPCKVCDTSPCCRRRRPIGGGAARGRPSCRSEGGWTRAASVCPGCAPQPPPGPPRTPCAPAHARAAAATCPRPCSCHPGPLHQATTDNKDVVYALKCVACPQTLCAPACTAAASRPQPCSCHPGPPRQQPQSLVPRHSC